MEEIRFARSGDSALTIEFGKTINVQTNDDVLALDQSLAEDPIDGIFETIPTYCSLLVTYQKNVTDYDTLCEALKQRISSLKKGASSNAVLWEIPCCYGSHFGLDMEEVCRHTGLSQEEVIRLHTSVDYRIYMLGFLPGFVYLGGMDPRLEVPRLSTPRTKIPRGSVGIGGKQTGIYPMSSPGGWHLIGCTPIDLYDPDRENPVLVKAGDRIRFVPITSSQYYDIRQEMLKGTYVPVHYPVEAEKEQ